MSWEDMFVRTQDRVILPNNMWNIKFNLITINEIIGVKLVMFKFKHNWWTYVAVFVISLKEEDMEFIKK